MKPGARATALAAAIAASLSLSMAVSSAPAKQAPSPHPVAERSLFGQEVMPGEVIVRFERAASSSDRAVAKQDAGASHQRKLLLPRTALVEVTPGAEKEAAARLERDPNVLYAEPNAILHEDATPNDTRFTDLWGLNNTGQQVRGVAGLADADVDAPEAWNVGAGLGSAVRVAVVDSGVVANHPDLAANMFINPGESGAGRETNSIDDDGNGKVDDFRGWDFAYNDNNPTTNREHGTHVAGTIAAGANNSLGVAGTASYPNPQRKLAGAEDPGGQGAQRAGLRHRRLPRRRLGLRGHDECGGRQRQHQLRRHLGDARQRHQEQAEHAVRGRGRQRRGQQRHFAAHALQPRHRARRGEQDLRRGRQTPATRSPASRTSAPSTSISRPPASAS